MQASPIVSIIVPCYNGAKYLPEALDSILNQTYSNIEIIVINDGSTDHTNEVMAPYLKRVQYIEQKNMGQAATLNKGWALATGEFLAYLSCDDALKPQAVETSIAHLLKNPHSVGTYCDYNLISTSSEIIKKVQAPEFSLYELCVNFICQPGPGAFFKTSSFKKSGGWNAELRQMPDQEFWMRLCSLGPLMRIPQNLAQFRIHGESQSYAVSDLQKSAEPILIAESFFNVDSCPEQLKQYKNEALASAHLISARLHLRSKRFLKGLQNFLAACKYNPKVLFKLSSWRLILSGLYSRFKYRTH